MESSRLNQPRLTQRHVIYVLPNIQDLNTLQNTFSYLCGIAEPMIHVSLTLAETTGHRAGGSRRPGQCIQSIQCHIRMTPPDDFI